MKCTPHVRRLSDIVHPSTYIVLYLVAMRLCLYGRTDPVFVDIFSSLYRKCNFPVALCSCIVYSIMWSYYNNMYTYHITK